MTRLQHLCSLIVIWQLACLQPVVGVAQAGLFGGSGRLFDDEEAVKVDGDGNVSHAVPIGNVDVAYQNNLLAMQEMITNTSDTDSWEWVFIRINGAGGLEAADTFSPADTFIEARALTSREPPVEFHNDMLLSHFVFDIQRTTDSPEWFELGVVAYEAAVATQLELVLKDVEFIGGHEVLINTTLDLPLEFDTWVDLSLQQDMYELNISLWRSFTPLFTPEDHAAMDLTEVIFDLDDGSVASLVHKTSPGNTKAVLYLAGRADSFAHPHVLQMYEDRGYDFYSIDPRYCGRARRFMEDTQYGHWIDDFDVYTEEINDTLEFMRNQQNYSSIVAHAHSTGALVALNHAMLVQEEDPNQPDPFDGYILNGPFLDWGHVGGLFQELLLENAGLIEWAVANLAQASGLSEFHTRIWILYRYNTDWRPIIQTNVGTNWAQAATDVQRKITSRQTPVTSNPVLFIASLGDNTLLTSESVERMPFVASNHSTVILEHNSHDITYSFTKELNDIAIEALSDWLDTFEASMGL